MDITLFCVAFADVVFVDQPLRDRVTFSVSSRFTELNAALRIWNCLKAQFYTNLPGLV